VGTANSLIRGVEYMEEQIDAKKITFSFFLATGDDDFACSVEGGIDFAKNAATPENLKQLKVYPGARHTMKHDLVTPEYVNDVIAWYKKFL
jgi:alpha-beta hydrolase superfamily lysophospholipase